MADYRFPAGAPPEAHSAEDVLLQGFTETLRSRSLYVPPARQGVRAEVVPRNLYRKYMANALIRQAQAIAAQHDARDLALNHRVQAVKESASGFAPPYTNQPALHTDPQAMVDEEMFGEYEDARSRFGL